MDVAAWLRAPRAALEPAHRVARGPTASDGLHALRVCLRAGRCAQCGQRFVDRAAFRAGRALCVSCALADRTPAVTTWVGWDVEFARPLEALVG
jgi:hypothetical protein